MAKSVVEEKLVENNEESSGVDKSHPLCSVKGVGPKTAEKLIEAGVSTPEQLACLRPDELADMLGITKKAAKDMTNYALSIALDTAIVIKSMQDEIDHRREVVKRIPTGSSKFDAAIKGGIPTEAITLFKGEAESGKSEFCHQLVVNTKKYYDRKAVWISTENMTFSPDRINDMAKAIGCKINPKEDILFIDSGQVNTPYSLFIAYQRVAKEIETKGLDVGIFVVDSFTSPFRRFYGDRSQLPDRSREESRHLGYLDALAKKFNIAVVLTAQIMDIPDQGGQLGERAHSGHDKRMVGGNVLRHSATYGISLAQVASYQYEGVIFASPDVPKTAFRFSIKEGGIRDI
jgi:RecA/RadA recombinase